MRIFKNMSNNFFQNIAKGMQTNPSDRFFLDTFQSLVLREDLKYLNVKEPYYTIDKDKLAGEKIVFKAFFTFPRPGKTYSFSKGLPGYPEIDGVLIITEKRLFIHFKNTDQKPEDIEVPITEAQVSLQRPLKDVDTYNKVHSTTSSDYGPALVISAGGREVKLILVIAINANTKASIKYERGFAGLVQYYALIRMIRRLLKSDDKYYEEIKTYYDPEYSLMRPSELSCYVLLAIIAAIPLILVLVAATRFFDSPIPGIIAIVIFIILFISGIVIAEYQFRRTIPKEQIKPELLSDRI